MSALVQVSGVHKYFTRGSERIDVLKGVNLQIPQGDFVALMGPSGSGKTTLLNLLGGLDAPSAGSVEVAEIYEQRRAEGTELVVVLGDLNDTPGSDPLAPLFATDLRDIASHPTFDDLGWPGTFGTGGTAGKIDYLLCSPAVFGAVTASGVFRKGAWTASGRWEMYPTLTREHDAASDHAALWADVDL